MAVEKDLSSVSLGPNPMPHLAHVIIGLESPCHQVNFQLSIVKYCQIMKPVILRISNAANPDAANANAVVCVSST